MGYTPPITSSPGTTNPAVTPLGLPSNTAPLNPSAGQPSWLQTNGAQGIGALGGILGGLLGLGQSSSAGNAAAAGENSSINALLPIINMISSVYGSSVAPSLAQLIPLLTQSAGGSGNTALTQGASGGGVGTGGAGAVQGMNDLLNAPGLPPEVLHAVMSAATSANDRSISDAGTALAGAPNQAKAVKDVAEQGQQNLGQTESNLAATGAQQQAANETAGANIGTNLSNQGVTSGQALIQQLLQALNIGQAPVGTATTALGGLAGNYAQAGAQAQQQSGAAGQSLLGGITSLAGLFGL